MPAAEPALEALRAAAHDAAAAAEGQPEVHRLWVPAEGAAALRGFFKQKTAYEIMSGDWS
eukprot:COSAG02_NODE_45149_length_360_cov_0.333333_1_plen_59_part_01